MYLWSLNAWVCIRVKKWFFKTVQTNLPTAQVSKFRELSNWCILAYLWLCIAWLHQITITTVKFLLAIGSFYSRKHSKTSSYYLCLKIKVHLASIFRNNPSVFCFFGNDTFVLITAIFVRNDFVNLFNMLTSLHWKSNEEKLWKLLDKATKKLLREILIG